MLTCWLLSGNSAPQSVASNSRDTTTTDRLSFVANLSPNCPSGHIGFDHQHGFLTQLVWKNAVLPS
jgi:hypothetical protein